jgi:predicted AlkP superfamily pyrophosphatase or phosphodiesterase
MTPSSGTYTGGLARLQREGYVFEDARHVHAPTETGPGHAVISTGRFPGTNGIVGNNWFDRRLGSSTYCVADSVYGLGPELLWGYALGDALKAKDSESRVVSVSLKDRAAILLGGKKPDAALWYSSKLGAFRTSSYYQEPKWLGKFNRRLREKGEPLRDATTTYQVEIARTPEADRMVLELALEAAKRFKLGRDDHPDILFVSFSATDYIGHRYGPDSPQMDEQLRRLDGLLGELLDGAERQAGRGRVDLILTADHGAHPHPREAKRFTYDEIGASIERALQYDFPVKGRWLIDNAFPNLYFDRDLARRTGLDWRVFLREAAKRVEALDGIAKVYIPGELDAADPYAAVYARSLAPGRSGDLVARPSENTIIYDPPDIGEHGTPYEYDYHVPLVFWGPDAKTGRSTDTVRVADLAPTAAALLGFSFKPEPDSRVLPALK